MPLLRKTHEFRRSAWKERQHRLDPADPAVIPAADRHGTEPRLAIFPARVEHGRREPAPDEPLPALLTDLNQELVEEALLSDRSRSRACRK